MDNIEMLEMEIKLLLKSINTVKKYVNENKGKSRYYCKSIEFGELKHRIVAMKSTMSAINKLSTIDILKENN